MATTLEPAPAAPRSARRRPPAAGGAAAVVLALASGLVVAPVPDYDPWMWLLWGREVAGGTLSTVDGPAFKPLPVAVCALLAPLGAAAPAAWVLLARAAAFVAVWLAYRLGTALGGSRTAGLMAAAGVALCGAYPAYAAAGVGEGVLLCCALGAVEAWRRGHPRVALACAVACGLLRVEAWPFLLAAAWLRWGRRPPAWAPVIAVAVPALWLVPEWLGSGDVLRSGARARIPNPGQPALADVPALTSLGEALALPLWPLWAGVAFLAATRARAALAPAAVGAAWIALVAAMAQAGFSGEPRYALPGAALIAMSGAVGLAAAVRTRRAGAVSWVAVAVLLVAALPRLADVADLRPRQAYQRALVADLRSAVAAAGGAERLLDCGRPYTGRYRGPMVAYALDVPKRVVGFAPAAPGVVLRSRLTATAAPAPDPPPGFAPLARTARWAVSADCAS